jgi:hypothetical protein
MPTLQVDANGKRERVVVVKQFGRMTSNINAKLLHRSNAMATIDQLALPKRDKITNTVLGNVRLQFLKIFFGHRWK